MAPTKIEVPAEARFNPKSSFRPRGAGRAAVAGGDGPPEVSRNCPRDRGRGAPAQASGLRLPPSPGAEAVSAPAAPARGPSVARGARPLGGIVGGKYRPLGGEGGKHRPLGGTEGGKDHEAGPRSPPPAASGSAETEDALAVGTPAGAGRAYPDAAGASPVAAGATPPGAPRPRGEGADGAGEGGTPAGGREGGRVAVGPAGAAGVGPDEKRAGGAASGSVLHGEPAPAAARAEARLSPLSRAVSPAPPPAVRSPSPAIASPGRGSPPG